jgi:uncharacterized protein YneF (UPF0154 family)
MTLDQSEKRALLSYILNSENQILNKLDKHKIKYLESFELAQILGILLAIGIGIFGGMHIYNAEVNRCSNRLENQVKEFQQKYINEEYPNYDLLLDECYVNSRNKSISDGICIATLLWLPGIFIGAFLHRKLISKTFMVFQDLLNEELKELGEDYLYILLEPDLETKIELLEKSSMIKSKF